MRLLQLSFLLLAALVTSAPVLVPVPVVKTIPILSTSQLQLAKLVVGALGSADDYTRGKFHHWINLGSGCNTREIVLRREGVNVVNKKCHAKSGLWTSLYDGSTWESPADIQIDHMVPLKNAWMSGANKWSPAKRESFANDLVRPQLWAITGSVNNDKGSLTPDLWRPPLTIAYCNYAKSWIAVKSYYNLIVTEEEKLALEEMLKYCTEDM
ncbi:hypothetical protein BROUX41_000429 [Berkeleyomyces rouxiae]|uniref:uncharacterized protein n=1 Tax=Berkeleyomyces rouxiae TaxID=2035830 RepID=UPI003B807B16